MTTTQETKKIFKSTLLFSGFVLLAQIFGLVRDLYLAKIFGVGQILDTYYLAFKIPDFLNVFYSVFLGSVIFIPLLTKLKSSAGEVAMQKKINSVGSLVFISLLISFIILEIFMPTLTKILAPTWSETDRQLLTQLSRILLFAQFFFPVGILAGAIGMIYQKPVGMAVSGFIYNFGILLGALVLVPIFGIFGLAYAVIFGAILFMLVQISNKNSFLFIKNFRLVFPFQEWLIFIKENSGRFFAVLSYQLYGVLILAVASLGGAGGVSSFSIAYNLYLAGFFVLGASFSTVLMPRISLAHVEGKSDVQKKNLQKNLSFIFLLSFLAAVVLFFGSEIIVKMLYAFSDLTFEEERNIAGLLSLLAISFPFFNCLEVLRKYLYSTEQIFLASIQTIFLLLGVIVFTFLLNIFTTEPILTCLIFGINLSMIFTASFTTIVLRIKKQI